MQNQLPVWVLYVQALGTPIAAFIFGAIAAMISYKQYLTSVHKFRFDLFEKRNAVYRAIHEVFGEFLREDKISNEGYSKFFLAIQDAKFLFGDEIKAYIDTLIDLMLERQRLQRRINERKNNDHFDEWYDQLDRNWERLSAMMKEVTGIFEKYLKFRR